MIKHLACLAITLAICGAAQAETSPSAPSTPPSTSQPAPARMAAIGVEEMSEAQIKFASHVTEGVRRIFTHMSDGTGGQGIQVFFANEQAYHRFLEATMRANQTDPDGPGLEDLIWLVEKDSLKIIEPPDGVKIVNFLIAGSSRADDKIQRTFQINVIMQPVDGIMKASSLRIREKR